MHMRVISQSETQRCKILALRDYIKGVTDPDEKDFVRDQFREIRKEM